jgi:hypothetical protein
MKFEAHRFEVAELAGRLQPTHGRHGSPIIVEKLGVRRWALAPRWSLKLALP